MNLFLLLSDQTMTATILQTYQSIDYLLCMHQGIAEAEDIAALPTVQFWKDGKCVDVS